MALACVVRYGSRRGFGLLQDLAGCIALSDTLQTRRTNTARASSEQAPRPARRGAWAPTYNLLHARATGWIIGAMRKMVDPRRQPEKKTRGWQPIRERLHVKGATRSPQADLISSGHATLAVAEVPSPRDAFCASFRSFVGVDSPAAPRSANATAQGS
jgi:hypothetical protein